MLTFRTAGRVSTDDLELVSTAEIELARIPALRVGSLEVHPPTLQIVVQGASRTIEPRVMQVLVALAAARGTVVSRDRLIEQCWGGRVVGEDAINRGLAKVRRLGTETGAFEIETIPRVGYRLLEAGAPPLSTEPKGAIGWLRSTLAAVLLLIALAAGGIWYWRSTPAPPQPTIAVLPFTAINSDPAAKNLGEIIRTRVSTALVQTGAQLPYGNLANLEDARRAGAAMIVSGTVERETAAFRLTIRVDSARSRSALLTNEFEGAPDEASLTGRVTAWLVPPFRMWASFLPMESDASVTDEIMRIFLTRALGDFEREQKLARTLATAKPDSGAAQWVYAFLSVETLASLPLDDRAAAVASARRAAERSAALLQKPGRAQILLDCYFRPPGTYLLTPECDRTTRAALAADPDIPVVPFLFAAALTDSGRFVDAAHFADVDLAASPLGMGQLAQRVFAGRLTGGYDGALPDLEDRARRYSGPTALASFEFQAAVAKGEIPRAEALASDAKMAEAIFVGDTKTTAQSVFKAVKSRAPADIALMRKNCNPAPPDSVPLPPALETCLAGFAVLGDMDGLYALAFRAFDDVECCSAAERERQWLVRGGDYYPRYELSAKALAPARADPRFIELARRTALLPYWRSGHAPDFCQTERVPVCALLGSK